ncbi:MAG: TetR/AcrR family transcriptional regulator [Gemmatimonadales bacterium]
MPDPSPTRDQILDAAEALFARQGFSATPIKEIAAKAGVNSALLYYYFADKETLYKAMLSRVIESLIASLSSRMAGATDPTDAVRRFAIAQTEAILANPLFPRLILRELLDHEAKHAHEQIASVVGRGLLPLVHAIELGQRAGTFRADVEPRFAAISIVGQVMYFFVANPAVAVLLGTTPGPLPPDTVRKFARHAGDFAVKALSI